MSEIQLSTLRLDAIIAFIVSFVLLFISGVISSSEVAFFSNNKQDDKKNDISTETYTNQVKRLIENPQRLLATILISNNLANISYIIILAFAISSIVDFSANPFTGFVIQAIVITLSLLLFGEILPKIYASQKSKIVTKKTASFLYVLSLIFAPLINLLLNSTSIVNNKMTRQKRRVISKDELTHALELTTNSSNDDKELLEGIIRFGDKRVIDIMTSRVDMIDIDSKLNFKDLLTKVVDAGYSRIPVYTGSRDNIKGVLYAKDLLPHLDKPASFRWQTLIRAAFYVPETKMIDDLLNDFQQNRVHLAIVVDEFGGASGLVSLEDILEEIVGDISDEYDVEEKLYTKIDNHTYIFEAKIQLNDFFKIDDIDETTFTKIANEVETLAGLILEIKGEIPSKNERFDYGHYVFEILSVDNRRIKKVKLHIKNDPRKED